MMKRTIQYLLSLIILGLTSQATEITIDLDKTIKADLKAGAAAANLCWLLSSERQSKPDIPLRDALEKMGCGALRFPYGALADNYLWHTPPYVDTEKGLRPRVAHMNHAPGKWSWAVNEDASFKDAMDFDEYMELCQKANIEPLVVVNILSDKINPQLTYDQLKKSAVEWVKYAKSKSYRVAYWQIGNEVDHKSKRKFFTAESYAERFRDITLAMKTVDPTIKTGPGLIGHLKYFWELMKIAPEQMDFVSAHQYMFGRKDTCGTYQKWKEDKASYIPTVEAMQRAILKSPKPDLKILITETGVTPANDELGKVNNTYKALWWFEVLMNEISIPNVSYAFFWGVHTPWFGDREPDVDVGTLLTRTNLPKPTGQVSTIVNRALLDRMVDAPRQVSFIRAYASASQESDFLNVLLMNKDDKPQEVVLSLKGGAMKSRKFQRSLFKGLSPEDRTPTTENQASLTSRKNLLKLTLPPLSITLLKQEK
jgi:alpha-L-arabinofuranosidase